MIRPASPCRVLLSVLMLSTLLFFTDTVSSEHEAVEVAPDHISVQPLPQHVLDYFLPTDVYGDDAHTSHIGPPVPFSPGLRAGSQRPPAKRAAWIFPRGGKIQKCASTSKVALATGYTTPAFNTSNKGFGYALALNVESARTEIVKNDMGLLIGIQIDGRTVIGQPATESQLVDFGGIAPKSARTAHWIMSCSLSGRFIDFDAEFTRADQLGGQMTSLIAAEDIITHFLVGDVTVDADGSDSIEDVPVKDDDACRGFESDFTQTDVADQSADSTIDNTAGVLQINTPPIAGYMYVRLDEPFNGTMLIESATRSDGKRIKAANVWFSKTREDP